MGEIEIIITKANLQGRDKEKIQEEIGIEGENGTIKREVMYQDKEQGRKKDTMNVKEVDLTPIGTTEPK